MTTSTKTLTTLVDVALAIEKLRVASEVRQVHLGRQGKQDPETDELHRRLKDFEGFVDGRVSYLPGETGLLGGGFYESRRISGNLTA